MWTALFHITSTEISGTYHHTVKLGTDKQHCNIFIEQQQSVIPTQTQWNTAPRGHFLKMGTTSPKERVPQPKMKPWTFHSVSFNSFCTLVRSVPLCLCRYNRLLFTLVTFCSMKMLQCCLSVPSLTVWWYVPLISVEVMWNRAVHIVSRLAKRSQLGSSLWLLAEVAWWRERERERDEEEVKVAAVISPVLEEWAPRHSYGGGN